VKNKTISIIINAKKIIKLIKEDETFSAPIIISVMDYMTSDSKTLLDKEELENYFRRLIDNDHITHLSFDRGILYVDIRRGGAIKELDNIIKELELTGHRGYHGILTLDNNGINNFYNSKVHPDSFNEIKADTTIPEDYVRDGCAV